MLGWVGVPTNLAVEGWQLGRKECKSQEAKRKSMILQVNTWGTCLGLENLEFWSLLPQLFMVFNQLLFNIKYINNPRSREWDSGLDFAAAYTNYQARVRLLFIFLLALGVLHILGCTPCLQTYHRRPRCLTLGSGLNATNQVLQSQVLWFLALRDPNPSWDLALTLILNIPSDDQSIFCPFLFKEVRLVIHGDFCSPVLDLFGAGKSQGSQKGRHLG